MKAGLAGRSRTRRGWGDPRSSPTAQHIIDNSYLNGETIRLDGAIRMVPRPRVIPSSPS